MKKGRKTRKIKTVTFEESLKKVEEITSMLEDGDLPLQKRVEKFEEGIKLLKKCEKELKEVELTIQKVIDKGDRVDLEKVE
jgi:exodeoxyribonuclease VII small subunit